MNAMAEYNDLIVEIFVNGIQRKDSTACRRGEVIYAKRLKMDHENVVLSIKDGRLAERNSEYLRRFEEFGPHPEVAALKKDPLPLGAHKYDYTEEHKRARHLLLGGHIEQSQSEEITVALEPITATETPVDPVEPGAPLNVDPTREGFTIDQLWRESETDPDSNPKAPKKLCRECNSSHRSKSALFYCDCRGDQ